MHKAIDEILSAVWLRSKETDDLGTVYIRMNPRLLRELLVDQNPFEYVTCDVMHDGKWSVCGISLKEDHGVQSWEMIRRLTPRFYERRTIAGEIVFYAFAQYGENKFSASGQSQEEALAGLMEQVNNQSGFELCAKSGARLRGVPGVNVQDR